MNNLSLQKRIGLIVFWPVAAFIAVIIWQTSHTVKNYQDAKLVEQRLELVIAVSSLADQTQVWRGKSASFLNGTVSSIEQIKQYELTMKELKKVEAILPHSGFNVNYQNDLKNWFKKYPESQRKIEIKATTADEEIHAVSKIVDRLLRVSQDVAHETHLPTIAAELRSLAVVESAKESGGKLRANIASILTRDRPLTPREIKEIISFHADVEANMRSKALVVSKEGQALIDSFYDSKEWKETDASFRWVLSKANEGQYLKEPSVFFKTATKALNLISKVKGYKQRRISKATKKITQHGLTQVYTMAAVSTALCCALILFSIFNIKSLRNQITEIASTLRRGSSDINLAAESLSKVSHRLSEGSVQQATSIQETASSTDEINAMVTKNADSARVSKELSEQSNQTVRSAQNSVKQLMASIDKMIVSNDDVVKEVDSGNNKISEIVSVIQEIGEKTKIINDIVFQTKLLSFNASVEAARAGEHGKGFAVVAEEVGNLAAMSGEAAGEISTMLHDSIEKVKKIIEETKTQVSKMTETSSKTMEDGKLMAEECNTILDEALEQVSQVNTAVNEIASASQEQAQGLQEVTNAVGELDQATQSNTDSAQKTHRFSNQLLAEAEAMESVVKSLMRIVNGGGSSRGSKPTHPHSVEDFSMNVDAVPDESLHKSSNVIPFPSLPSQPKESFVQKVAVGHDTEVPSSDDPDFEDF